MSAQANGYERSFSPGMRQGSHVAAMQRRRLLSAIVEVLAEHGLEGAGVGRVCKRAGVSRRTFYDLFEDRDACFLAAFELAIEQLAQKVVPVYEREGRWRERVRAALTTLLECLDEQPGLARLCLVETLKGAPEVLERRRRVLVALIAAVDEGRLEAKGTEPPPLTAESTVGGAVAVIHARLLESHRPRAASSLTAMGESKRSVDVGLRMGELLNPLMSMIVHPYLGPAASRRELERAIPAQARPASATADAPLPTKDPFKDLPIRITFRTARVLATVAAQPGASNRDVGQAAGVGDQGQMSKLLRRLEKSGLIENHGEGQSKGEPNAWFLTDRGQGVLQAVTV